MAAGIALSRWFGEEAKRVFAMLSESDEERDTRELKELIERLGGSVTVNELRRHTRKDHSPEDAELALQTLVKLGVGYWEEVPTSERGGRPTRRFVLRGVVKTPWNPKKMGVSVLPMPKNRSPRTGGMHKWTSPLRLPNCSRNWPTSAST